MKSIDELFESFNDQLTNKIDLFLLNNIEDKQVQLKIIELLNESFLAGINDAIDQYDELKKQEDVERLSNIKDNHNRFMEVFTDKLLGETSYNWWKNLPDDVKLKYVLEYIKPARYEGEGVPEMMPEEIDEMFKLFYNGQDSSVSK